MEDHGECEQITGVWEQSPWWGRELKDFVHFETKEGPEVYKDLSDSSPRV